MKYADELIDRLSWRRAEKLGKLSEDAFDELRLAVTRDPDSFLEHKGDVAFKHLADALAANDLAQAEEEFLDDEGYEASRNRRLDKLRTACAEAISMDGDCLDARTIAAMLGAKDPDASLAALLELASEIELDTEPREKEGNASPSALGADDPTPDSDEAPLACASEWNDVFARPRLRLLSSIARARLETARYKNACNTCERLIELDPTDQLGARYTWAIALARLEDEKGFDALDARFGRQGNAWNHLARTLLMFKLDRMPAARRALRGYTSLCRGGAYALLRPTLVEGYLPDRPAFEPGSFEEAALAVHECDSVVMDTPDFLAWATAQDGFAAQAEKFARDNDLDW